jgi:enamine deaminase RidA (YjgF/YER057c/UK114 family)
MIVKSKIDIFLFSNFKWVKLQLILLFLLSYYSFLYSQTSDTPEARLEAIGITLPTPGKPIANYVPSVTTGNLIFLSGAGPIDQLGHYITGKVGADKSVEEAQHAAKLTAIRHLSILKEELGELSRVKRIIKVLGMVNCVDGFDKQPQVINGYSDLMVEVFREKGKHARSAIGVNALPMNMLVEIEMIVEFE